MKEMLCILVLIIASHPIFAQEKCAHRIYVAGSPRILYSCCILEITDGNLVHYITRGDTLKIHADKVIMNGKEIFLEEDENIHQPFQQYPSPGEYSSADEYEHDISYYEKKFHGANTLRNTGIFFTIAGVISGISGSALYYLNDYDQKKKEMGQKLSQAGFVFFNIGLPLWIYGGIKRFNNKKSIDKMKNNPNLSIRLSGNGLGLSLNF